MAFYRRRYGYGGPRRSYGRPRRPYYGYRSRARTYGPRRGSRFVSTRRVRFGGRRY